MTDRHRGAFQSRPICPSPSPGLSFLGRNDTHLTEPLGASHVPVGDGVRHLTGCSQMGKLVTNNIQRVWFPSTSRPLWGKGDWKAAPVMSGSQASAPAGV